MKIMTRDIVLEFIGKTAEEFKTFRASVNDRNKVITKGSLSYLSSPCFSKNVLQSGVGIVH